MIHLIPLVPNGIFNNSREVIEVVPLYSKALLKHIVLLYTFTSLQSINTICIRFCVVHTLLYSIFNNNNNNNNNINNNYYLYYNNYYLYYNNYYLYYNNN